VRGAPGGEEWTEADDMGLHERLAHARVSHLSAPDLELLGPDEVYVLIFNMENEDKGIYALRGRAMRARSHVLAFEESVDASQFAELLEAEGFHGAMPLLWNKEQLESFCEASAFEVSLVKQGALITPPANNEYDNAVVYL
jgi:hypothetical protein